MHEPDIIETRLRRLNEVSRDGLVRRQQVVPHHSIPLGLEDVRAKIQLVAVRVDESHEGSFRFTLAPRNRGAELYVVHPGCQTAWLRRRFSITDTKASS